MKYVGLIVSRENIPAIGLTYWRFCREGTRGPPFLILLTPSIRNRFLTEMGRSLVRGNGMEFSPHTAMLLWTRVMQLIVWRASLTAFTPTHMPVKFPIWLSKCYPNETSSGVARWVCAHEVDFLSKKKLFSCVRASFLKRRCSVYA